MTPGRVLIVEASQKDGSALARTLSREGHFAKLVGNGAAALREVCSDAPPDLVLMDLALPDMDPMKTVLRVKSIRNPEFLPVIALSAAGDPAARVRALRGGADDVVARPCEAEELAARVSALLRIRAAQEGLQQANQELERRSFTDPLTGLFNRRYFEYQLAQELERSRRRGDPVSLVLMDLDFFKRINDRYGHGVGDEVLKAVGTVLRRELRRLDVSARWGGEEFAAIMPNTGASGVKVVCQRILRAVRTYEGVCAAPLDGGPRETVHFTTSLGVAVHSDTREATTIDELFRKADVALYRAKSQGRDRASFAEGCGVRLQAVGSCRLKAVGKSRCADPATV
jgi:two-component system cell cycle response regulator